MLASSKSGKAYAAAMGDGSVVTWGHPVDGGNSGGVKEQLFKRAAHPGNWTGICCDSGQGSVVTWGPPGLGGDSSRVQEQLRNVQYIQTMDSACAAAVDSEAFVNSDQQSVKKQPCHAQYTESAQS